MRLVERTKVCAAPDCPASGEPQPWSAFYAKARWTDGTMRYPQAYCKACHTERRRERERRCRRDGDPTYHARKRRTYQATKADPERWGVIQARNRDAQRQRHGIPPERWRVREPACNGGGSLDSAPFAAWLCRVLAERELSYEHAAAIIGTDGSRLGKIANGKQARVSLDLVDRALLALDGPRIDDLYPVEERRADAA